MKKLFTLLLAVSLLFSIAATSAAAEGTGGTMYPNPLQDVRVRQALWYAIDMDAIVDALWNGTVTAAHKSLVPEGYWQADGLTEYTYNPEKAKELLAEAGWDGSRTLKAVYYTGNLLDTITAIQAYWNDVGVKMEFQLLTDNLTALLWTPSAVYAFRRGLGSVLCRYQRADAGRVLQPSSQHSRQQLHRKAG